jgi:UPF0755 protein
MKKTVMMAFFLAALVLLGVLLGGSFFLSSLQPVTSEATTEAKKYTIASGATLGTVLADLETEGLIKNAQGLRLYIHLNQLLGSNSWTQLPLQAGTHELNPSWSAPTILQALVSQPEQITITVLPGWRREEIAEYLTGQNLTQFDPTEFLRLSEGLEGRLAPDTYKIAPLSTAQTIINILQAQFTKSVLENETLHKQISASGHSFEEILIVATLLQREARNLEQMRMIADIIYSRLEDDYPLQLCASAQYATGKDRSSGSWWLAPSLLDTQINSPYNTYLQPGLPPGPICAPSLAALEAAATPLVNDYYYYLHDEAGQIHYARTYEEHQQNINTFLN